MKKLVLGLALAIVANAAMAADPVKYLDWDSTTLNLVEKTCTAYDLVTADTTALADGKWYVVAGNVVIENGGNIKVNGSAHLILCDNASLTIKNVANSKAAIDVSVSGSTMNALAIYGQQNGSGVLSATGGQFGAGIGGGGAGGTVTVNGGTVTAQGGNSGAGIGGGMSGAGGTVTINGGTVTAMGGQTGAGIGGGGGGAGGSVTINGGTVTATGGNSGAGIGGKVGDHGTVTFGAGTWLVLAGNFAPDTEMSVADYAEHHGARYVCIKLSLSLKIPAGMHYSYVVLNETTGAVLKGVFADGTNTYAVKNGSTVKVYFTLDEDYEWDGEFDNPKDLGVIESDKVVDASEMPKAKGLSGSETNPWKVGENVTAYIKDRVLYLKGTGAMDDFASAEAVPWAVVAGDVTAVTVEDGVTQVGKNAWAGMADAVTINGTALSVIGFAAPGLASGEPVIPDDKVLVSKEEIAAAKAETVTVDGGVVTLGVTVNTNGDFTAETKTWAPVELKSENVEVKDGKIVISIPVGDKSGFMILQSGDANVPAERLDSMWGVLVVD